MEGTCRVQQALETLQLTWQQVVGVIVVALSIGGLFYQVNRNSSDIERNNLSIAALERAVEPRLTELDRRSLTVNAEQASVLANLLARVTRLEAENDRLTREVAARVTFQSRQEDRENLMARLAQMSLERAEIRQELQRIQEHLAAIDRRTRDGPNNGRSQ